MKDGIFEVGDIVTVLDGNEIEDYCGGWVMNFAVGKQFKIHSVHENGLVYELGSDDLELNNRIEGYIFDKRSLELYEKPNRHIEFKYKGNKTTAIILENDKYVAHGNSLCNSEDTYNRELGEKIAICRAFGVTSDFIKEYVDKPKSEKVKEVSRVARVGEYVKIVNTHCQDGYYKDGDILKIVEAFNGIDRRFYKNELGKFLYDLEYVALEGYEPEK